jgi:hypothetical protein
MGVERTAQTYGPGITGASKSVLLELTTLLRAYHEALVLVGGWVPSLLLEHHRAMDAAPVAHVGSIDIDVAVDPQRLAVAQYATVFELLQGRGYRLARDRRGGIIPASMERGVQSPVTNKSYTIRIDFLTPLQPDTQTTHQLLQDAWMARKLKGCEAAFAHHEQVPLSGVLPDGGGTITVPVRMANVVGCLTMKGIVLGERYREKDAYDIYMVLRHYAGGPKAVAEAVRPYAEEPLVAEALGLIARAFATREAHGPAWTAAFLNPAYRQERERVLTDVTMVVHEFLQAVEPSRSHA